MLIAESKTVSLTYILQKKIDKIFIRVNALEKSYKHIYSKDLKIRLNKEYERLKLNFFEIKSLIILLNQTSTEKLSLIKLLNEMSGRCEKEIFKNNYLFST